MSGMTSERSLTSESYFHKLQRGKKKTKRIKKEPTFPVQSSARMQPSDQISIFLSYGSPKITSGAR